MHTAGLLHLYRLGKPLTVSYGCLSSLHIAEGD